MMIDVQANGSSTLVPTLDLRQVPLEQRASVWSAHAATFFPGAVIRNLPEQPILGQVARVPVGHGTLWYIHSPPALLQYRPPHITCAGPAILPSFGLVAQLNGVLTASQSGRDCALEPGDLCFLDAREAFALGGAGSSELLVLEMPRDALTGTHPFLGSHTACALKDGSPGAKLLRNTVVGLAGAAAHLSQSQRAAGLAGVLGMLGVLEQAHVSQIPVDRRVMAALSYIELHLADRELSAVAIAGTLGISRRRLDGLFIAALGQPVATQIWQRRFAHAASLLRDPLRARQCLRDIAQASGFEDTTHFVRAFKRRFGQTPGKWRIAPEIPESAAPRRSS
jgi:AraC family transcriptional activator of tynA and feaB